MGICSFLKTVMLKPRAKALLPSKTSKRHSVFVMYISIYSIYIHIIIKGSLDEKLPSYELLKMLQVIDS